LWCNPCTQPAFPVAEKKEKKEKKEKRRHSEDAAEPEEEAEIRPASTKKLRKEAQAADED
jgi:hypothetical protein